MVHFVMKNEGISPDLNHGIPFASYLAEGEDSYI